MQTIEEYFKDYLKSYDEDGFDEYTLSELRFCFFAGAIAMRILAKHCTDQAMEDGDIEAAAKHMFILDRELKNFVRERDGHAKVRIN